LNKPEKEAISLEHHAILRVGMRKLKIRACHQELSQNIWKDGHAMVEIGDEKNAERRNKLA